jgi:hypothetical protein
MYFRDKKKCNPLCPVCESPLEIRTILPFGLGPVYLTCKRIDERTTLYCYDVSINELLSRNSR